MSFNVFNAAKKPSSQGYVKLSQLADGSIEVPIDINLNRAEHFVHSDAVNSPSMARKSLSRLVTNFFGFLPQSHEFAMKILSALLYAVVSFLIVVVNKIILTNYQ